MNNLQEVSQKIQQLCVEMEKYGVYLSQISQSIAAWQDRLGISLEGTSQSEYIKAIYAFQASDQSVRIAIQSLSNATQSGQKWVLSHGSLDHTSHLLQPIAMHVLKWMLMTLMCFSGNKVA